MSHSNVLAISIMPGGKKKTPNYVNDHVDAWVILCGVCLIAVGVIVFAHKNFVAEFSKMEHGVKNFSIPKDTRAWIEIDFGNGAKRVFEGTADESPQTLSEALRVITQSVRLTFITKNKKIVELGDKRNRTHIWRIYKNGKEVLESPDELTIVRGNRYALKYER